jgi:hypothetical protein
MADRNNSNENVLEAVIFARSSYYREFRVFIVLARLMNAGRVHCLMACCWSSSASCYNKPTQMKYREARALSTPLKT